MPIHDFSFSPKTTGAQPEPKPVMPALLPNQPDLNSPPTIDDDANVAKQEDVEDIIVCGLHTMDRGVKQFFQDIKVPTIDGFKTMAVRVAGGDKTILFWSQDLQTGRVGLPVMSVNNTGYQFNPNKFSPAHMHAYKYFADRNGTRMAVMPREFPVLINYTLSIWAERKRDMEYILWQVVTRFNPVAEWAVQDEFMRGNMFATFEGVTHNSDIDVQANELAKVRSDVNIKVEGWMPLPPKIIPTVLGQVQELAEFSGEFLDVLKLGSGNQNINRGL